MPMKNGRALLPVKADKSVITGNQMKKRARDTYVIYRAWIKTRSGRKIYASQYGLKAFRILIKK
jgi:ribosomal protein L13